MTWAPCKHKTFAHHTVGRASDDNRLIWRCSACKVLGKWTEQWSYFGSIECRECWTADIEYVACSDACRAKLKPLEIERAEDRNIH